MRICRFDWNKKSFKIAKLNAVQFNYDADSVLNRITFVQIKIQHLLIILLRHKQNLQKLQLYIVSVIC